MISLVVARTQISCTRWKIFIVKFGTPPTFLSLPSQIYGQDSTTVVATRLKPTSLVVMKSRIGKKINIERYYNTTLTFLRLKNSIQQWGIGITISQNNMLGTAKGSLLHSGLITGRACAHFHGNINWQRKAYSIG